MGLFGSNKAYELRHLLETLQMGSLTDIDAIHAGTPVENTRETGLDARITKAARFVSAMSAKGKETEALAILAEFRLKPVPRLMLFRATAPTQASFEEAKSEAMDQLEALPPDPDQEAKNEQWRRVVDEIETRAARLRG